MYVPREIAIDISHLFLEMAVLPTRAHQSANVARALGDPYHGDRVSFRIRRRLLLHFPPLALLDQPRHRGNPHGVRRDTRGKVSLIDREISFYQATILAKYSFLSTRWKPRPFAHQVLTANATLAGERKIMLKEESVKSKHLLTLWEFEGALKYSPFFYGWYTNQDSNSNYRLPMAYFVTNLVVYTYSFVAILRKYLDLDLFLSLNLAEHSFSSKKNNNNILDHSWKNWSRHILCTIFFARRNAMYFSNRCIVNYLCYFRNYSPNTSSNKLESNEVSSVYTSFQNGGKFASEQTDREGGRVRLFVETLHGMGLYDR